MPTFKETLIESYTKRIAKNTETKAGINETIADLSALPDSPEKASLIYQLGGRVRRIDASNLNLQAIIDELSNAD